MRAKVNWTSVCFRSGHPQQGTTNVNTYNRTKCWTTLYAKTHSQHNETWPFLQTTGDKYEPNIVCCAKIVPYNSELRYIGRNALHTLKSGNELKRHRQQMLHLYLLTF